MSASDDLGMPIPMGISEDTGLPLDPIDPASLSTLSGEPGGGVSRETVEAKAAPGVGFATLGEVDPSELDQAGWGVIFSPELDPAIREALQPLLDRRAAQVGDKRLFKIFEGDSGFQPGDTASSWLERQNVHMALVDPLLGVPFYLMIVAPPDVIPFVFQYGLDLYWGVGRLWFPVVEEFRNYAQSVVRYETMAEVPTSRQVAVFCTRHEFDNATKMLAREVAEPLANGSDTGAPIGKRQKFRVQSFIGETATKDTLNRIFTGAMEHGPPALLFTGGHGKSFKANDPGQAKSQGSLITQDWAKFAPAARNEYYNASDIPAAAKVHGLVHFLFACYGGGWPVEDTYSRRDRVHKPIAAKPAMARLPQGLLGHPEGGALAVLAHIDRAWTFSFHEGSGPQTQGFRDVMGRILRGDRLGQATDQFNLRWAALSGRLVETLAGSQAGVNPAVLANQWVARDDARNYVLFGDPAVRLRVEDMPALG